MFSVYGHKNVKVLSGGLVKWVSEGRNVETDIESGEASAYEYVFSPETFKNHDQV